MTGRLGHEPAGIPYPLLQVTIHDRRTRLVLQSPDLDSPWLSDRIGQPRELFGEGRAGESGVVAHANQVVGWDTTSMTRPPSWSRPWPQDPEA